MATRGHCVCVEHMSCCLLLVPCALLSIVCPLPYCYPIIVEAPVREPIESAPEPAPVREPAESAPEPAPVREPAESAPEPAPVREPAESAPEPALVREPTESAPEPAPVREPAESAPEPAPLKWGFSAPPWGPHALPAPSWHPCLPLSPGPLPLHGPGPPSLHLFYLLFATLLDSCFVPRTVEHLESAP